MDLYLSQTMWRLLAPALAKAGIAASAEERSNPLKNRTSFRVTIDDAHRADAIRLHDATRPLLKSEQPSYPVFVAFFEDGSRDGWVAIAVATEAEARRVMTRKYPEQKVTRILTLAEYEAEMDVLDPDDFPAEGKSVLLEYGS